MTTTTVTLPVEAVQETLIALRDRYWQLRTEHKYTSTPIVIEINERQQNRVLAALEALADSIGESAM